jgi:hypothetical protein
MEYEKAAAILKSLLDEQKLTAAEKEAVFTALGVLAWVSLSKNKIAQLKRSRELTKRDNWPAASGEIQTRPPRSGTGKG